MSASPTQVMIDRRFVGPPSSGNGGYTAGLLASHVDGAPHQPVTVTLQRPPPLQVPLDVAVGTQNESDRGELTRLICGTEVVAEAGPGAFTTDTVEPVSVDQARAAETSYRGLVDHPFPTCFVCGTARAEGDGLRLSPGLSAPGRTACTWTPHPSLAGEAGHVAPEFVWSALDCPGGWTSDLDDRPLVLGRMTSSCVGSVRVATTYVVVARLLGEEGRKTFTASAMYDVDGGSGARVVARAEHVWIAIDPAQFP